jgi:phage gp16-like protein
MTSKTINRKALLAEIHIAKKAVGLSDDDYRALMQTITGVASAAELDATGLMRFRDHLRKCAAATNNPACQRYLARQGKSVRTGTVHRKLDPMARKVVSLWYQLADAALVTDRSYSALESWIKAQTGVDKLEWLKPAQLNQVIEQLKRWLARKAAPARAGEA